jgi:hypothetical protein
MFKDFARFGLILSVAITMQHHGNNMAITFQINKQAGKQ